MKVLLCGEGIHDIGKKNFWSDTDRAYVSVDGWLQVLCRKILNIVGGVEFDTRSRADILFLPRQQQPYRPLPPGHGAKALAARLIARREGFDALVFMVDADTNDTAAWREKKHEIEEGFRRCENGVAAIACVPMSASECWLLADSGAWVELGLSETRQLPRRPEGIWGARDDPDGNHPHRYFARICCEVGVDDSRTTRVQIAEHSQISEIESNCPVSFGCFSSELARSVS